MDEFYFQKDKRKKMGFRGVCKICLGVDITLAKSKVAVMVAGTLVREMQAKNNARHLDMVEKRLIAPPQDGKGS